MKSCQIGPAPVMPETSFIGALSALPTHTPTARSGVKPSVQLSRQSVVVPVFAAAGRPISSMLPGPNAGARAALSLRMSLIRNATRGSRTVARGAGGVER